ncbi:MAG: hypothetical protein BWY91_02903 [bacterium ADurb.BinA028]|nr:MAG: hypothetical protein BWY91_02903 [bacterium ADurb.BinA028]
MVDGVIDVIGDRRQLFRRDQRAHVDAPLVAGAQPHGLGPRDELLDELVVNLGVDIEALGRHAQLSAVGEGGPDGSLGRPVEVGVAQDEDRVLAAEFE